MDMDKLLEEAAAANEAELHRKLSPMGHHELVQWCRDEIAERTTTLKKVWSSIDPVSIAFARCSR